jgi:hypothetical protein
MMDTTIRRKPSLTTMLGQQWKRKTAMIMGYP